jgi:hypothetical protein
MLSISLVVYTTIGLPVILALSIGCIWWLSKRCIQMKVERIRLELYIPEPTVVISVHDISVT